MRLSAHWNRLPSLARASLWCAAVFTLVVFNRTAGLSADVARANDALVESAEVLYVPDDRIVKALTLGYDQAAADVLWLRTLSYFARHFTSDRRYRWLDHFVDQVIRFDPKFARVYHWAGANVLYGAAFTNDAVERSSRFYKLALEQYPEDYEAAYRLGLNYYIEMKSPDVDERRRYQEQGLAWLELAANMPGAPEMMANLVASISRKLGKATLASQYLVDMYLSTEDPEKRAEIQARLKQVNADSADAVAEAAAQFQARWHAHFAYVPPTIFSLMGEPEHIETPDVPWRTLVSGLGAPEPLAEPKLLANPAGRAPPTVGTPPDPAGIQTP